MSVYEYLLTRTDKDLMDAGVKRIRAGEFDFDMVSRRCAVPPPLMMPYPSEPIGYDPNPRATLNGAQTSANRDDYDLNMGKLIQMRQQIENSFFEVIVSNFLPPVTTTRQARFPRRRQSRRWMKKYQKKFGWIHTTKCDAPAAFQIGNTMIVNKAMKDEVDKQISAANALHERRRMEEIMFGFSRPNEEKEK